MIESIQNKQFKNIKALLERRKKRSEQGVFVVENPRTFREIPKEMIVETYVAKGYEKEAKGLGLLDNVSHYELVADDVFRKLSDTQNPQGIMAIVKQPAYALEDVIDGSLDARYIVLNKLQDPGNLGTIMRTAEAAGIKAVIMDRETVDIFSPKVVRATMGAILRVPFIYVDDLCECITYMKSKGIRTYAACLDGKTDFRQIKDIGARAYFIGNEGNGLSDEVVAMADEKIFIPMQGKVESLNAAVAAALLMYQ